MIPAVHQEKIWRISAMQLPNYQENLTFREMCAILSLQQYYICGDTHEQKPICEDLPGYVRLRG